MSAPPSASAVRPRRVAWLLGGSLLIASALVGLVAPQAGYPVGGWVQTAGAVLFAAAALVFASGLPDGASVTARRPVGTTALAVLGVWPLVSSIIWATQEPMAEMRPFDSAIAYVDLVLPLAAALVAVVSIARAGVVPAPWNWAPTWALAALVVPNVLTQLLFVAVPNEMPQLAPMLVTFATLVVAAAPIFLGVLALVLAQPPRAERSPVAVYPPPAGGDR